MAKLHLGAPAFLPTSSPDFRSQSLIFIWGPIIPSVSDPVVALAPEVLGDGHDQSELIRPRRLQIRLLEGTQRPFCLKTFRWKEIAPGAAALVLPPLQPNCGQMLPGEGRAERWRGMEFRMQFCQSHTPTPGLRGGPQWIPTLSLSFGFRAIGLSFLATWHRKIPAYSVSNLVLVSCPILVSYSCPNKLPQTQ